MSHSRVVAAVEMGTTKVAVLIGEIIDDSELKIIGHSVGSSMGVKKGVIVDLGKASDCVHTAIINAERNSQRRVDAVYLAQTGAHLAGNFNLGTASVSASDRQVRASDIEQAKEDAKRKLLPDDRTYIHHIQNPFNLDGQLVENPLAREGQQVQVWYWCVHGDKAVVSDCLRVINGLDFKVEDMIISSIASSAVLLEDAEKEAGALVIDIGGGTTDWVLYRKGYIVRTGVVPVGGDHISNDLSIGLRTGRKSAEEIKIKHGRAFYQAADRDETIWLIGDMTIGDREYPKAAVTKIIAARVDEIFGIIKEQLEEAELFNSNDIVSGVILSGGSARLEGLPVAAQNVFGLEARTAELRSNVKSELRKPEYSTALGLLHYALTGQEEKRQVSKSTSLLGSLINVLKNG
ncbi:MAG: cell division protein FtsA [Opitutales bacterium]|jgi:cell division protein FtsA